MKDIDRVSSNPLSTKVRRLSPAEAVAAMRELPKLEREFIAMRAAKELQDGMYVNLGIGIPTLASSWVEDKDLVLQSEIGMLRTGPLATPDEEDQDLINASCQPVVERPGCSFFSISEAFAMIRGGHIDLAMLGAFQVSEKGDLASWNNPSRGLGKLGGIGGAMDLAAGAKRIIVTMEHITNRGELRVVRECSYPVTAVRCVDTIITDLAVIKVTEDGLVLSELVPGVTPEDVQALTEPDLLISPDLREMDL